MAAADITLYEPNVDVSLAVYHPMISKEDVAPDIRTGIYFGGYFSWKSPFFTDYFNTKRIYTIYEVGLALNPIENESALFVTIPLRVSFGYRIGLGKKIALIPFAGTGLHLTYNDSLEDAVYSEIFEDRLHVCGLVSAGLELRWAIMRGGIFRLKFDYGIVFDNRVESGYTQYLMVRLPLPFIP
jgi:hypothetical protein